jgi:hypothetical protein
MGANFDGVDARADGLRHLGEREPLEPMQNDHVPLVGGELGERDADGAVFVEGLLRGAAAPGDLERVHVERGLTAPTVFPKVLKAKIERNRKEPRP